MKFVHILLVTLLVVAIQTSNTTYIWLDCDPGVDDTQALLLATSNPLFQLYGVSTSAGNTNLENTNRNARNILHNCHRSDIPVYVGAQHVVLGKLHMAEDVHGQGGLGGVKISQSKSQPIIQNSFHKMAKRIMGSKQKIIWVNTGALTNLYYLLSLHPQVKEKIKEIVIMGGSLGAGNITPAAQFNIHFDAYSAKGVLEKKGDIPLVMIPLDVTHTVLVKQHIFERIKSYNKPFSNAVYNMLRQFQKMYKQLQNFDFPPAHDPTVLFYILHPEKFESKKAIIQIDTYPTSFGRTNVYFSNPKGEFNPIDKVVTKCLDIQLLWNTIFQAFERILNKPLENGQGDQNAKNDL